MNISIKKIKALFKKDLFDYFKNPTILISSLIPIFFILLYKNILPLHIEDKVQYLLTVGTLFNTSMVGIMLISTSIAEEKEKFTLRTLILSNVSEAEFLFSKMAVGYCITMIGNIIIFFLSQEAKIHLFFYLVCTTLGCLCIILLSSVIGIISRDQMTCSTFQVPVLLLLMIPPLLGEFSSLLKKISYFIPLNGMMVLYLNGIEGKWINKDTIFSFGVLIGWTVIMAFIFFYIYKKQGKDNK